ncbi:ERCC4 domain-containing protein [Candidatus Binatus sp.]|uniref:ERCC4 domain-containing protein n=1 Tax=Candidatus Binatus sp. TaxID=2811406 RepID=UPI003C4E1696
MRSLSLTVLIDSREQTPLLFPGGVTTERATLKTGDYSVLADGVDMRDVVGIERKSVSDLLGCIGGQRDRFERELARLAQFHYRALVIEGTLADLVAATAGRQLTASQVMGSVLAWTFKYSVAPIFAGNRALAATTVATLLRHARYELASRTGCGIAGPAVEPEGRGLS